jgi:penicillin-binding protein 2
MPGVTDQELPDAISSIKGATVKTSIMTSLQDEAAEFLNNHSGAIVVMEIETGRVLALASGPSYDPNLLSRQILPAMIWNQYSQSILRPLINKATSSTFFPGSTFKIIPAMAGLHYNVITPQKEYLCLGCLLFGHETKCCWNRGGHGWVNLRQSLKESCDIYYYYLSKELGLDRLTSFAELFNVGHITGIDIPFEERGVLPNRSWFHFNHPGQHLHSGYVMNTAIGQGDIRMTPLQIASLYSAIANNGVIMKPKLVDSVVESTGEIRTIKSEVNRVLQISPTIYKTIMKALWAAANEAGGTAYYYADRTIPDAVGKTGTSQVIANIARRRIDYTEDEKRILTKDDVLFVALFPYKNPKIVAVAVVAHGGHGGAAAAPIIYRLLRLWHLEQGKNQ